MLCARGGAAQDSTDALLDRAARLYHSAKTLRAKFDQTLTSPGTNTVRSAAGEFLQRGPDHFALRFTDPAGDAIVNDGAVIWVYLPSTTKGQVIKMPHEAGAGLDFFAELLTAPREHYSVASLADETVASHVTAVFALTPKKPNAPFTRATLWIGRDDATLWKLETVEPSGLVRRLSFTTVRFGAALPKGALTFDVPEGVRVVDPAAMLGGKP
jgi:chaperone LolA